MVVETGSFSESAKRLRISQPAITFQIQSLEQSLHIQLIDRSGKKVQLTEAGEIVHRSAKKILAEVDALERSIEEYQQSTRGALTIGASSIPGEYVLPKILGAFKKEYPEAVISLQVTDTENITERVLRGELDVGVVGAVVDDKRLDFKSFLEDELVFIVPSDYDHYIEGKAALSEVIGENVIAREEGSGTRMVVEKELAKHGLKLSDFDLVMELGSTEAILTAVEAGLGTSIVSRWAAEKAIELGRVRVVEISDMPIRRKLYIVTRRGRPFDRLASLFLQFLQSTGGKWKESGEKWEKKVKA
jgi:DNA-binding transcriptional LysR family regulator